MPGTDREVRFCYRCGKRVGKNLLNCWYCSSPTVRVIRPPRNCPYCQTRINAKALKCPHCGEFVDGRAQAPAPQHFTLNIDKAVIGPGGVQPMGGPQGQSQPYNPQQFYGSPPGDPSRTLDTQGYQQLLPGQSELLLPNQGGQMPLAQRPQQMLPGPGGGEVYPAGGSNLAPYQGPQPLGQPLSQPPRGGGDYLALSRPPESGGGGMAANTGASLSAKSKTSPAAEEERYAICHVCNTEILNSDSFCFYCGQQHTAGAEKAGPAGASVVHSESNTFLYVLSIVLFALSTAMEKIPQLQSFSEQKWGASGLGFLLLAWAFFRNTKLTSRILTGLLILVGLFLVSL